MGTFTSLVSHARLSLPLINAGIRGRSHAVDHIWAPRCARPGVSAMEIPFHDPFNGDATSAFDDPDALGFFWDELNAGDLTQPCPQSTDPPTEPHTLQQQEEEDECQDGEEQVEQGGQLLLQEWDGTAEPPVDTLRYTVEWKAVLKTKRLGMNTEEDIFLSPKALWDATLQHSLDTSLEREFSQQNRPEPCNTLVVVSVSKRAERDLTKEFVGLDVDWSLIGEKLESWACHFREGKRLLVKITFRFRPRNAAPQTNPGRGGRQSATRRQRHQQALQQDAEMHASGEGAHWRAVYRTMRCPGRPCNNNQGHCWRDPHGGKHYKLLTAHMRKLVTHMNEGNKFESHHDVPDTIRQQLYAEADQRTVAHRVTRPPNPRVAQVRMCESSPASEHGGQQCSPERTPPTLVATPRPIVLDPLDIPGSHEKAIQDYVKWQQDQADSQEWIGQFAKAGDILITQGFRLNLFYQTQRLDLLTEGGVLQGIAESFHNDLPQWAPEYSQKFEESQIYSRETPGYI